MSSPGPIAAASALFLLAGAPGDSKETHTIQDALQICARIQTPADRLACFEGLAKANPPEAATGGADQTAQKAPQTASELKTAKKAEARTASEQKAARKAAAKTASEQRATARERQRLAKAETDSNRDGYDAVVMRAWQQVSGNYYVALTNGEVWKGDGVEGGRPVKDGEAVLMHPGFAGSWFMQFKTVKRPAVRVQLVE